MRYTESHEWIDEKGKCGLTEFAKKEIQEASYIELPKVGRMVKREEPIALIESSKSAIEIYAPVSGKIVEVNEELQKDPSSLMKRDSYLFVIAASDKKEYDLLMTEMQYKEMLEGKR